MLALGFSSGLPIRLVFSTQSAWLRGAGVSLVDIGLISYVAFAYSLKFLWAPIIDGAADLLSETEPSRIRKCESCVVHFFDTSKKGSRRWCSMNICGNKLKVAAYQRRKRDWDSH